MKSLTEALTETQAREHAHERERASEAVRYGACEDGYCGFVSAFYCGTLSVWPHGGSSDGETALVSSYEQGTVSHPHERSQIRTVSAADP